MFTRTVSGFEPVNELLRQAFDNLISLLSKETEHRETNSHIAADEAAIFDEPNFEAILRRRQRRGQSCWTATDDKHIVFSAYWN
jgi:hypothetical protein